VRRDRTFVLARLTTILAGLEYAPNGGSVRGPSAGPAALRHRGHRPAQPCGGRRDPGRRLRRIDDGASLPGRLRGRDGEHVGVGPAVVLGQNLAELPRPVADGSVADLAAGDREMGNGHREAAGTRIVHHFHNAIPAGTILRHVIRRDGGERTISGSGSKLPVSTNDLICAARMLSSAATMVARNGGSRSWCPDAHSS
jgi:hypothetical protein